MDAELHLILLWSEARHALISIKEDITKHFQLVDAYTITWDKDVFAQNLTRFYGQSLPKNSFKEQHCGNGPFTLFLVVDEQPQYAFRRTSHGISFVNTNLFDAKVRYRNLTGGGHKVHTTNTPDECAHDLYLLLGETYQNVLQNYVSSTRSFPTEPKIVHRNLTGHDGWNSFEHFFEGINECLKYIVLRNFEHLPNIFTSDLHGDIDFLVENLFDAICVMNANNVGAYKAARHFVSIAGQQVPIDLHQIDDNSYCPAWAEDMLHSRIRNSNNVYVPTEEHAYHALNYHIFFQKNIISPDYPKKLAEMAKRLPGQKKKSLSLEKHWQNLHDFMLCHDYTIVRPNDKKLPWDERFSFRKETVRRELEQAGISEITLCNVATAKQNLLAKKQIYFKGYLKAENRYVFIKWNGITNLLEHEFFLLQKCHAIAPTHFPKPIFCSSGRYPFLVIEFLQAHPHTQSEHKDKFATDLCEIADALHTCEVVHRNISPESIICTPDSIYLVDFKWAFDQEMDFLPERDAIRLTNPRALHDKLCTYSPSPSVWDDAHALFTIACSFLRLLPSDLKPLRNRIGQYRLSLA